MNLVWVFIGGGIGSAVRYGFGRLFIDTRLPLPMATFCSNISSCFIFAVTLLYFTSKNDFPMSVRLFVLTGICGGLSTFSTFSFETFELLRQNNYTWALLNILLNTILCILIFYIFSKINLQ